MNKKQKICLWVGLAVLDIFGLYVLQDRVVRHRPVLRPLTFGQTNSQTRPPSSSNT